MTSQKGVGITPACATFRLPIGYNQLNKQMHSVVYVHNCCDRNVSTPKRPNRNHLDQNGSDRNGLYRNGQTESARTKRPDRIVAKYHQWRNEGGRMPGRRITGGVPKSPSNVASFFFNAVHLLPKDLRFKYGSAKLVSCPGRNLTSVSPLSHRGLFGKKTSLALAPELIFFRSLPRIHDHS